MPDRLETSSANVLVLGKFDKLEYEKSWYDKSNLGNQLPFNDNLFIAFMKEMKFKIEKDVEKNRK